MTSWRTALECGLSNFLAVTSVQRQARNLLKIRLPFIYALGTIVERRNSGVPQQEGSKMSDWRIRHKDADGHNAQATLLCREAAIVQALFLERRQHCRVEIIEGPDGKLIDRETFEREHLKKLRW